MKYHSCSLSEAILRAKSGRDIQRFVIQAHGEITSLHELMEREHSVVRFDHSFGDLIIIRISQHIIANRKHSADSTFGLGRIENVDSMRSGYSSRSLESMSEPKPAPVPPPRECMSWKPCSASHCSVCWRTTSWALLSRRQRAGKMVIQGCCPRSQRLKDARVRRPL